MIGFATRQAVSSATRIVRSGAYRPLLCRVVLGQAQGLFLSEALSAPASDLSM